MSQLKLIPVELVCLSLPSKYVSIQSELAVFNVKAGNTLGLKNMWCIFEVEIRILLGVNLRSKGYILILLQNVAFQTAA